jgi:hypothetical protein
MQCDDAGGGGTMVDALGRLFVQPAFLPRFHDCICAMASTQTDVALYTQALTRGIDGGEVCGRMRSAASLSRTGAISDCFAEVAPGVAERDRAEYARLVAAVQVYMYERDEQMVTLENVFHEQRAAVAIERALAQSTLVNGSDDGLGPLGSPVTPAHPVSAESEADEAKCGNMTTPRGDGDLAGQVISQNSWKSEVRWQEMQDLWSGEIEGAASNFDTGRGKKIRVESGGQVVAKIKPHSLHSRKDTPRELRLRRADVAAAEATRRLQKRFALPTLRDAQQQENAKRARVRAAQLAALPARPCADCEREWWKRRLVKVGRSAAMDSSTLETWKRKKECIHYMHMDAKEEAGAKKRQFIDMHAGAGSDFECTPTQSPRRE